MVTGHQVRVLFEDFKGVPMGLGGPSKNSTRRTERRASCRKKALFLSAAGILIPCSSQAGPWTASAASALSEGERPA